MNTTTAVDTNDLRLFFKFVAATAEREAVIASKEIAVQAQDFETASNFRDEERTLTHELADMHARIKEIGNQYLNDDNRATNRDGAELSAAVTGQPNA